MEHIKVLNFRPLFTWQEMEVKTIMDTISKGFTGVEEFEYCDRQISEDALDKFITSNKTALSSVSLNFIGEVLFEKLDAFLLEVVSTTFASVLSKYV